MALFGIFLFLAGFILAAVGIILVIVHRNDGERRWWMWGLLAGGVFIAILGIALWLYDYKTISEETSTIIYPDMPGIVGESRMTFFPPIYEEEDIYIRE